MAHYRWSCTQAVAMVIAHAHSHAPSTAAVTPQAAHTCSICEHHLLTIPLRTCSIITVRHTPSANKQPLVHLAGSPQGARLSILSVVQGTCTVGNITGVCSNSTSRSPCSCQSIAHQCDVTCCCFAAAGPSSVAAGRKETTGRVTLPLEVPA